MVMWIVVHTHASMPSVQAFKATRGPRRGAEPTMVVMGGIGAREASEWEIMKRLVLL